MVHKYQASSQEDRERHSQRRKNKYAKLLRDQGDFKGAFSLKVINPKKGEYKRERITVKDINTEDEI